MNIEGYRSRLLELERRLSQSTEHRRDDVRAQVQDSAGDASVTDEGKSKNAFDVGLDAAVLQEVRDALQRIDNGTFGR
jgi:RNA polymerase-binding transcription factor DksA